MDVARPFAALLPGVDSAVLAVLARSKQRRTGREIALAAQRSPAGTRRVLERLAEHGLVDREAAGKAFVYSLNRDHLAAPAVEILSNLRAALVDRLRREIAGWEIAPAHAALFGSAARGDGDATSDIDIFIVRPPETGEDDPEWREQLDSLAEEVMRWTGNHAGLAEISAEQLGSMRERRPPIADELDADAIRLAGPDVGAILSGDVDGAA